jgi:anti-anti-sigma regulatory factor
MESHNVRVGDLDGVAVAWVRGRFDTTTATDIGVALARASERDELILSLRECTYIDLDGIGVLARLNRSLRGRLVIVDDSRPAFDRTGMYKVIRVERSIEEAVRWMRRVQEEA